MPSRASLLTAGILCGVAFFGCEAPSETGHALVGHQAPPFTATMLDDRPFDLAEYLGKNVIVLDFWATWCGPCRQALPTISEVTARYKNQGVEFFAVDVGESAEVVQQFLDETGLHLAVIMDQGPVSDRYQVEFLPQTVIIGRDGTIAAVHVGSSSNLEAELTRELDALVAGKSVAEASSGRTEPAMDYR